MKPPLKPTRYVPNPKGYVSFFFLFSPLLSSPPHPNTTHPYPNTTSTHSHLGTFLKPTLPTKTPVMQSSSVVFLGLGSPHLLKIGCNLFAPFRAFPHAPICSHPSLPKMLPPSPLPLTPFFTKDESAYFTILPSICRTNILTMASGC